jgi:hypothetical protein
MFRATAEQVLNHILPVLAGIKPNLSIKVEHQRPVLPKLPSHDKISFLSPRAP